MFRRRRRFRPSSTGTALAVFGRLRPALMIALVALAPCPAAAAAADRADELARTAIVANTRDPDSVALAEYYAERRGIPRDNILALPLPLPETLTWPQFVENMWNPLRAELVRRGWIDAVETTLHDDIGRRRYAIAGHRLSYLVLMRGVPLRIAEHQPFLPAEMPRGFGTQFRTNRASVDGELALIAVENHTTVAFLPNPFFRQRGALGPTAAAVVRVARLDGPTPEAVRSAIDGALLAERVGLVGRAYVDIGGPHAEGDRWLEEVARRLDPLGYELDVDRERGALGRLARFDAPALYFGWYETHVQGPFAVPGFRFPPGAVAVHIHSYSASTLRSDHRHWCGPLVARGAAATVGNVHEPYLQFTHHLGPFVAALIDGETLGTAAYRALPALSWQAVVVGDPHYRPFAVSPQETWRRREELPAEWRGFAALRAARVAEMAGRTAEAGEILRTAWRESPGLSTGLAWARHVQATQGDAAAVRELGFVAMLQTIPEAEFGVARAVAALLLQAGAAEAAVGVYETMVASVAPGEGQTALLRDAVEFARSARQSAAAARWQLRLDELAAAARAAGAAGEAGALQR
jgi:uncharacterized protein (TIGR03790 family)